MRIQAVTVDRVSKRGRMERVERLGISGLGRDGGNVRMQVERRGRTMMEEDEVERVNAGK